MASFNYKQRICISQVACDGNRVQGKSDICYHCKNRMLSRTRPVPPLKGERTALTKDEMLQRGLL